MLKRFSTDDDNKIYHKVFHKEIIFHYTGKYRGTGYHICNLRCKAIKEIPVIFHICST